MSATEYSNHLAHSSSGFVVKTCNQTGNGFIVLMSRLKLDGRYSPTDLEDALPHQTTEQQRALSRYQTPSIHTTRAFEIKSLLKREEAHQKRKKETKTP